MNAIKIIQDKMEKISEQEKIFRELWDNDYADNNAMVNIMLEWIINEISSLPSDTQWIDRLNNLKNRTDRDYEFAWESQRSYDKWQIDILEEILSNKN